KMCGIPGKGHHGKNICFEMSIPQKCCKINTSQQFIFVYYLVIIVLALIQKKKTTGRFLRWQSQSICYLHCFFLHSNRTTYSLLTFRQKNDKIKHEKGAAVEQRFALAISYIKKATLPCDWRLLF
ncbi:MAG: hypothetical protein ACI4E4_11235, partial [Acetatifactor sp.]